MDSKLKLLKDVRSECCVTIVLNTHRTKPENQKDAITLKNLISEAEDRLLESFDKRTVWSIIDKIKKLNDKINHNFNLDSLILFANEDVAEFVRLAIPVKNRVIIDKTFATRDLIRAIHEQVSYYALVISRQNARLIEAQNDLLIKEFDDGTWPIKNTGTYTTDRFKLSTAAGQDNMTEEFFNQVDKVLNATIKESPLSVILVSEERNFNHYIKVADNKSIIVAHLNKNRDDEKPHHIITDTWPIVYDVFKRKREEMVTELGKAISSGQLLSDLNEIWVAVNEGRGKMLFIKKGTFMPAKIVGNKVVIIEHQDVVQENYFDDIIDEIIEINLAYGGDNIFLENDVLTKFGGLALITRY